jgi:hypothetical protein
MRDLHNSIKAIQGFKPVTITNLNTATATAIIDRQGFESVEFLINIGDLTDANATFAVLVEEGDNSGLSDAAAVADADLLGTEALAGFTFADDNKVAKIGYRGNKRYTRLTVTPAGNDVGSATYACTAVLGKPMIGPQTAQLI